MRTTLSYWFKVSFAILLATSLSASLSAQDETSKEAEVAKPKVKVKRNRAEERRMRSVAKTMAPTKGFTPVEMFSAMESGEVDVLIKTIDATKSNLIVTNKSDKHLAIEMPKAFSAVPVFRQLAGGPGGGGLGGGLGGGGLGGGGLGGGGFGGGGNQGIGGGFGGGAGGGGFGGGGLGGGGLGGGGLGGGGLGGGGVFNIPPGKVGKLSVKTFCLEEGKADPFARLNYRIQPLEKLNSDPKIFEMCRMLANDEVTQPVAQAAAWNVANGLTWQQLFYKNRVERMDGSFERFFHPNHIRFAQQVVAVSAQRAEWRSEAKKDEKSDEERYQDRYNQAR